MTTRSKGRTAHPGALLSLAIALCLPATAVAQAFANLGFEQAQVDDGTIWQSWESAVPGWQHSDGADTQTVFWGLSHVGLTQIYRLYGAGQAGTPSGFPFEGQYGIYLQSGLSSSNDLEAFWVSAFLAQTGTVPAGTRSLHLYADGPLAVSLGNTALALIDLGNHHLAADVTAFAGQTLALRITHGGGAEAPGLYLDGLRFSTTPVPEPATGLLALSGAGLLGWRLRQWRDTPSARRA